MLTAARTEAASDRFQSARVDRCDECVLCVGKREKSMELTNRRQVLLTHKSSSTCVVIVFFCYLRRSSTGRKSFLKEILFCRPGQEG